MGSRPSNDRPGPGAYKGYDLRGKQRAPQYGFGTSQWL